jgi:HpiC1 cyclase
MNGKLTDTLKDRTLACHPPSTIAKLIAVATCMAGSIVLAGPIAVPNASFESPTNNFVSVSIDSWQKSAKPDWYVETNGFQWTQLTGIFLNTPTNSVDHIDNCEGRQALYLFATPEVGLFQDYDSVGSNDPQPTHAFDALFEVGKAYNLTVGVIGGGGGMTNGASLQLGVYYRDGVSNRVVVAATNVIHNTAVFSNTTHLVDFSVSVPPVQPNDAWVGQHIGILFLSTISTNLQPGGYWDMDNVRLTGISPTVLSSPVRTNNQFQFLLQSEPGLKFEMQATTNSLLNPSDWTSLGTLTNATGSVPFVDTDTNFDHRYYRARQLP